MIPGRSKNRCKSKWLNTQNLKSIKSPWTDEEDTLLRAIVQSQGTKHWSGVAKLFNQSFPGKERAPKQCRDRWLNYLSPNINKYS
jgi:myb proto-oncogene protein